MAKQDDYIKTALRIPRALHARLTEAAEARGRSLNAEFVARLMGESGDGSISEALTHLALQVAERDWELHLLRVEMIGLRDQFRAAVDLLALTDMSENGIVKEWIASEQELNSNVDDLTAWQSEAKKKAVRLVEARKAVAAQLNERAKQKGKKD